MPSLGEQAPLFRWLLPLSHGSSPKTAIRELEGVPSAAFPVWDSEGGGGDFGVGALPPGEAPAPPLTFPSLFPSGSSSLGDPATLCVLGRALAA